MKNKIRSSLLQIPDCKKVGSYRGNIKGKVTKDDENGEKREKKEVIHGLEEEVT